MPRIFDGPIPERPVRNALPEHIQDLLDRVGGQVRPDDGERPGRWFDLLGTLGEHVFHDRGDRGEAKVAADDAARIGPAAPAIATPAGADRVSADAHAGDAAALNFHADGEFTVRGEHYISQSLTAHADWFLP